MTLDPEMTTLLLTRAATILGIVLVTRLLVWLVHRLVPGTVETYLTRVRPLRIAESVSIESPEELAKRAVTLSGVFVWALEAVLIAMAIVWGLGVLGVDTAPAIASLGVVGIAIGFAGQAVVKDAINGALILLEDQYRVGDVVKIAGIAGLVEDMGLRRTVLRDLDGIVHSIPNGEVSTSSNFTRDWSRVNLNIAVRYNTDVTAASAILNHIGEAMAADPVFGPMITEAPQFLRVDAFAETGVELKVLGVTKPIKQWDVMGEYRRRVLLAFAEAGIEIPHLQHLTLSRAASPTDPA